MRQCVRFDLTAGREMGMVGAERNAGESSMGRTIYGAAAFAAVLLAARFVFGVNVDIPTMVTVIVACAAANVAREIA